MSISTEPITLTENTDVIEIRVITDVIIHTPWYMRATWYLQGLTLNGFMTAAALYWISARDGHMTATSLHNNAVMVVLLLMDVYLSKFPCRLLHVLHSCLYFIAYVIFSVTYFKLFEEDAYQPMYRLLDWRKPLLSFTVVTTIVVLFIPLSHLLWFSIHKSRFHLWKRYGQS